MAATEPTNGNGITVKEMVQDLSTKFDRFIEDQRRRDEALNLNLAQHGLAQQRTDIALAKLPDVEVRLEALEDYKLRSETTTSTLKWVFGGSSLAGIITGGLALWAALGGPR